MTGNEPITGQVFDIQRFSLHDGPGIRTTVFMMYCPLSCLWCHNPECNYPPGTLMYDPNRCKLCGNCVNVCKLAALSFNKEQIEIDRNLCVRCGECIKACCTGALRTSGKLDNVKEVFDIVIKDKKFYVNSGGGVTVSGGEPLVQWRFVLKLLQALHREGIHTAVDTCGFVDTDVIDLVAEYTNLFLFDLKHCDTSIHKKLTGVGNEKILTALEYLDSKGMEIWVRIPVVSGYNDELKVFEGISGMLNKLHSVKKAELLPYHPLGEAKYYRLGLTYQLNGLDSPNREKMEMLGNILKSSWYGDVVVRSL